MLVVKLKGCHPKSHLSMMVGICTLYIFSSVMSTCKRRIGPHTPQLFMMVGRIPGIAPYTWVPSRPSSLLDPSRISTYGDGDHHTDMLIRD